MAKAFRQLSVNLTTNVSCQLNFRVFQCQLFFPPFVSCQLIPSRPSGRVVILYVDLQLLCRSKMEQNQSRRRVHQFLEILATGTSVSRSLTRELSDRSKLMKQRNNIRQTGKVSRGQRSCDWDYWVRDAAGLNINWCEVSFWFLSKMTKIAPKIIKSAGRELKKHSMSFF